MSDLLNEQLSALIDGELPAAETALLLKRLEREPALRERLARYRVCGETMRGARVRTRTDFTLRVCAVLSSEACHTGTGTLLQGRPARSGLQRYLRPLAGLGVAAAVAAVAILVVGRPQPAGAPAQTVAVVAPTVTQSAVIVPVMAPVPLDRATNAMLAPAMGPEPQSYVTPAAHQGLGVIPRAELANYVVVHSSVGGPLGLPSGLANILSDDPPAAMAPSR